MGVKGQPVVLPLALRSTQLKLRSDCCGPAPKCRNQCESFDLHSSPQYCSKSIFRSPLMVNVMGIRCVNVVILLFVCESLKSYLHCTFRTTVDVRAVSV